MKPRTTVAVATFGVLVFAATAASAAVVCNQDGDCWRTKGKFKYPSEAHVHVYADDWQWRPDEKYRWRDPGPTPGYWSKDTWVESPIEQELQEENE